MMLFESFHQLGVPTNPEKQPTIVIYYDGDVDCFIVVLNGLLLRIFESPWSQNICKYLAAVIFVLYITLYISKFMVLSAEAAILLLD